MAPFPCTGCGACCRRMGWVVEQLKTGPPPFGGRLDLMPDPPVPILEDGTCGNLQADNSCAVYETRPLICRVDEIREHVEPDADPLAWQKLHAKACNTMVLLDGMGDKYLINIRALGVE